MGLKYETSSALQDVNIEEALEKGIHGQPYTLDPQTQPQNPKS